MNHLDLFSGIGGFALAARWMDWRTIGFVEKDKFCQKVLTKHWQGVQIEEDIKNVTADTFREHPDIITGGFPCQPFSVAGKRRGTADDRYLWPEMARVIKEYKPRWVLGENVAGIIPMELDSVLSDLEVANYEVWPLVIPACGVDAKHRRARVWIVGWNTDAGASDSFVADPQSGESRFSSERRWWQDSGRGSTDSGGAETTRRETLADTLKQQRNRWSDGPCRWPGEPLETLQDARQRGRQEDGLSIPESLLGRVANGIPHRVDRLRSLGNAIVPQVAYEIFREIEACDEVSKV